MHLTIINPNTTTAMTDRIEAAARRLLPASVHISAVTARFGTRYIASRASFAVAGHAALDAFASQGASSDAVLLACFGDPGLDALREVAGCPVISLIDAAAAEAGAGGRRFSVVTGGERWGPMLADIFTARGLGAQLATIRTVAPNGSDIARDPSGAVDVLVDACERCLDEDGADAVILGGAGLIGIADMIQPRVKVPVVCSVAAGLRATAAALSAQSARISAGTDRVEATGLSAELTGLFRTGGQQG